MSLYNMLHGRNPAAPILLAMLNLTEDDTGRFRDCFAEKKDNGDYNIIVYTRNGGGNREDYQGVIDELAKSPHYLTDYDDDFDCTYASIEFKVPDEFKTVVANMYNEQDQRSPKEKWTEVFEALEKNDLSNPRVKETVDSLGKMLNEVFDKATPE